MSKRSRSDEAEGSVVVNLNTLPDPPEDGRKAKKVLKKEQLEEKLLQLKDGWPDGDVQELHFDPLNWDLKWKAKEVKLLDSVLSKIGSKLRVLDLSPRAVNSTLPASIASTIVASCTGLQTLRVSEMAFNEEAFPALSTLTELRELVLGGIAVSIRAPIPVSGLGGLQTCTELHTLHIDHCDLRDEALVQLVQGATRLTDVDFSSAKELTEVGVQAMATACTGLRRLVLLNCEQVGPSGVRALAGCTRLEELNLQRVRGTAAALAEVCRRCVRLRDMHLSCCFLSDDDVQAFPALTALTSLDLNATSGYGFNALRQAVPQLAALRQLSLNSFKFPVGKIDAAVEAIGQQCSALTDLDLNNSLVSSAAVAKVRELRPDCRVTTMHCPNAE